MDIKFRLRYLPRPCMKQGCKDISMSVIYLKQASTDISSELGKLKRMQLQFNQMKIVI